MPRDWVGFRSWTAHRTFGLRREWVGLVLRDLTCWRETGGLGPRQVQSLAVWLHTAGLLDRGGRPTALYTLFQGTWPEANLAWQLLWAEVALRFPTASWYVQVLGCGEWTMAELQGLLHAATPHLAVRTVYDALLELVGLLERTPVGAALGQGEVSSGRPRRVRREGLALPHHQAVLHALRLLFLQQGRRVLWLDEDLLWPWVVFGTTLAAVWPQLLASDADWLGVEDAKLSCWVSLEELAHVALF